MLSPCGFTLIRKQTAILTLTDEQPQGFPMSLVILLIFFISGYVYVVSFSFFPSFLGNIHCGYERSGVHSTAHKLPPTPS